jgi:hypothetical protein
MRDCYRISAPKSWLYPLYEFRAILLLNLNETVVTALLLSASRQNWNGKPV